MSKSKLKNIRDLSEELGLAVRTIRTFQQKRLIPYYKLGHRLCLFDADKVRLALEEFEVKTATR
jgi:hypothetical protein